MINDELTNYIKENKQNGFSDNIIEKALLDVGWKKDDIKEGFKTVKAAGPKKKSEKLILIIVAIVAILAGLFAIYQFSSLFDFLK